MKPPQILFSIKESRPPFYGLIFILPFFFVISTKTQAQKTEAISVLIVDGFSNHDWKQTTIVTKWILEESDLFQVEICTVPADSAARMDWLPTFDKYDVVTQNTNNKGETYPPAYQCAGYQTTVVRVAEWLATGSVTFPVPSDFPTASTPS